MMPFYPQALAEPRTRKVSLWEHLFLAPHYILEASIYISWEDKTLELPSIINPQPTGSSHILCERLRLNFLPPFQFKTLNRLFEYFFFQNKMECNSLAEHFLSMKGFELQVDWIFDCAQNSWHSGQSLGGRSKKLTRNAQTQTTNGICWGAALSPGCLHDSPQAALKIPRRSPTSDLLNPSLGGHSSGIHAFIKALGWFECGWEPQH